MALFTDGPINATVDLQKYENGIPDVAGTESIDLAGKSALAQNEIATELMLFLLRRFPLPDFQWTVTVRRIIGVKDVVVTESLRQWHAYKTLALVYRDAYNNQLNDRFKGKWNEYEQLAKTSSQNYFQIGVGIAAGPIAKATLPILTVAAGTASAATYYVAAAWINQAGQEGCPSDTAQISTSAAQVPVVGTANPPVGATGWNAYVGATPDTISLQNSSPIAIGATWTMTAGLSQGIRPGQGQLPTWFLVDQRLIERG